jgi:hexokinase
MSSSLLNEATRIAGQFEYPAEQVQRGVAEYIKQSDEGLGKEGTTLSQIPTFVTAVPNGTEKVRWQITCRGLKTNLLVVGPISRR